jgi:hypothetical protein
MESTMGSLTAPQGLLLDTIMLPEENMIRMLPGPLVTVLPATTVMELDDVLVIEFTRTSQRKT